MQKGKDIELFVSAGDSKAFSITKEGNIIIREDLTYEEWREGLKAFKWAQINLRVSFADYVKFGEIKFGSELASEALTQLEFPLTAITSAVQIGSVPKKIRKFNLSGEHLVILARSCENADEMQEWAKKASEQSLSPVQLKESIRQGEVVEEPVAKKNQHGFVTIHALRMEADIWLRRMGGLSGLSGLSKADKEEIEKETELFVQIHEAVSDGR
jgi:hypothetical protein